MIYLQLASGLGNQMFEYAFARALQQETGEKIAINIYGYTYDAQRDYSLAAFELNSDVFVLDEKKAKRQWEFFGHLNPVLYKLKKGSGQDNFYKLSRYGLYITFDIYNFYKYHICKNSKYIYGNYQTEKYFKHIKETVLKDFRIRSPLGEEVKEVISRVKSCESVCVHIRRGDYVTDKKNDQVLNICSKQYYIEAMDLIRKKVSNPVFYIFSNTHEDIEWIKKHYHLNANDVMFVDMNNKDYEELFIMSSCRHFIISNSTYSWWAQYLGKHSEKIVVAPDRWNAGEQKANDIYMDTWTTIEV